jgi:glycosyltransferase involved in cell wall biosynthesis
VIILQANKFFHEKGGSERYYFALSRALEHAGHRVVPFAMAHPRNLPSPYAGYFVPERSYDTPAGIGSVTAALRFIRSREAARRIDALVAETSPQVAHLHNIYHQLTPSIIDALARRGVPVVMTLHDYKLACPSYAMFARGACCYRCRGGRFHRAVPVNCGGSRARSALLAIESYWQRWTRVYEQVDCFIAPSGYLRGVMVEAGIAPERIVHVTPLNPSGDAGAAPDVGTLRRLDALPSRYVAYVGRLSAEKGVHVLLEAAKHAPEIPVVVFGEGPEDARLRAMAHGMNQVIFAGHAPRALVEAAFQRAVAIVLPTLSPENAPMAILEAADAGVPVIVSDRGGLPEMAARVGGRVVPAGDARALAASIREAWDDAPEWRERAGAAWRANRSRYARETHIEAVESVYRRVMAKRGVAA